MLDIKFIRENPEEVKKALKNRSANFDVDYLLQLDEKRRGKIKEVDDLRAHQNTLSEEIQKLKGDAKTHKVEESRGLKVKLGEAEFELKALDAEFYASMRKIPNMPLESVPVGKDEWENKVLREVGKKPKFKFAPKDYMEIAVDLDLIDTERAAKVSGSRFGYIKNEAALLEFALVQLAFERLTKHEFVPVVPPVLIKEEMMRGMGYVDSENDLAERYCFPEDKQFLVGTSEQSVGPMHKDEVFKEDELSKRYAAFSTCFRREAGSYGKDTHGILRVHQFDKIEMFSFAKPEDSVGEHELLLKMEEELMQALELPYRVVALCTGDLSQPSAATFDIEAWLPGQNNGKGEYRETHSSSNTTDYQARRLNVKYRSKTGKAEFVHMLNGTAFAIGRMLIAIIENYQQEDGSVEIPKVLQKYMGGIKIINKKQETSSKN
ncbi:MAG: Serine-tRNA ligase [Parcubacteria group bacterium GW2011_GWA2_45_30]|nr:MAG: Serine-tRNA ligase [Parcubacteria group bacterium GW2011_GWA2_45_30]